MQQSGFRGQSVTKHSACSSLRTHGHVPCPPDAPLPPCLPISPHPPLPAFLPTPLPPPPLLGLACPPQVAVGVDNLLLRGSALRKTDYVIGLAVYTGADAKIMMNRTPAPRKVGGWAGGGGAAGCITPTPAAQKEGDLLLPARGSLGAC